jgi:shikimate kinase
MAPFRIVYITGFMGCGKTTAGKILASELKFSFVDLDQEIERKEQRTVAEIFEYSGEDYFRNAEASALRHLKITSDTVISTGGGTPCYCDNLSFMKETGVLIYLKMTPQQLKSRLGDMAGKRPLLKDLKESEMVTYISNKLKEREPFYNQATMVVDGMNLNIKSLRDSVLSVFI